MDFWTSAEDIPALPGAYVLAVELRQSIAVVIGRRPPVSLDAGRYLYCGSAKGSGGLRARIARHMRHGKAMRWHIDNLTEAGRVLGAWTLIGGDECELMAALAHLPVPIEGFGSSDCRNCRSHLLRWPESKQRHCVSAAIQAGSPDMRLFSRGIMSSPGRKTARTRPNATARI